MIKNSLFMMENNIIAHDLKVVVFRSSINTRLKADQVRKDLLSENQIYQVNIDLEDSENILRVECHPDCPSESIKALLAKSGFKCAILAYEIFQ